ncbi:MAG: SUMF1/EgtB/PvdO family nonheme iron enzyme, partial [Chloroflexi bacterium]|nr:SUMF1/EgtB/PvdO family nonheme iron enzyme [Chloroflexota bacterium]
MPVLSPDLYEQIVKLCEPHFRLADERDAHLTIPLRDWEGYYRIDWSGSPRGFTIHLVELLPPDRLQAALRALLVGYQAEQEIEQLCQRIDADQGLLTAASDAPFVSYHQERVQMWSKPRYRYDSRFVQLTLLLDKGPDAQDIRFVPDSQHHRYNSLPELLNAVEDKALVLLGNPGSGKTTLLRRLQWERAWSGLKTSDGKTTLLAPLSGYTANSAGQPPPPPEEWLETEWRQMQRQHPSLPAFQTMLQQGRLLLLLDGLNEMPHQDKADYRARIDQWRQFLYQTRNCGNIILFSCRSLDYSAPLSGETVPVRQVRVEPLSPAQIEAFLQVYLAEESDAVWEALRDDSQRLELFANPFFLRLLAAEAATTGDIPDGQAALLTGFVRRALRREIEERHSRLFQPGELLNEADYEQVLHRDWLSAYDLPAEGELIPHLEKLAFAMQDGRQSEEGGQVRIPERTAVQLINQPHARDLIAAGIQLNVLDKDLARRELLFFHQLIQEYFAARKLAQNPQHERAATAWRADEIQPSLAEERERLEASDPLPPPPPTGWEETTLMAAAMTPDQEAFVTALKPLNLTLAARCAAAPDVQISHNLRRALQQALLERLADEATDLRVRIGMAEALADLGDPRFERQTGPHGAFLLPPLAGIPGGAYPIGDDNSQYADERPARTVGITPFEMGVFPVTNAEYALFMEAGGYEDERWWQTEAALAWLRGESGSEGIKQGARDEQKYLQGFSDEVIRQQKTSPEQIDYWLWLKHASSEELERQYEKWYPPGKLHRQPEYWEDGRFNHPSRPVVGITWFEARAYCAWLSAQTGWEVKLPTEVEWEAAAGGKAGREYAYGDRYENGRCNTFETYIRRTTPVGIFPNGHTPEGIHDLSGNVLEWTSTIWGKERQNPEFPYPYDAADGRENIEDGASRRVLRGGSWYKLQYYARAAARYNDFPDFRYDFGYGFR